MHLRRAGDGVRARAAVGRPPRRCARLDARLSMIIDMSIPIHRRAGVRVPRGWVQRRAWRIEIRMPGKCRPARTHNATSGDARATPHSRRAHSVALLNRYSGPHRTGHRIQFDSVSGTATDVERASSRGNFLLLQEALKLATEPFCCWTIFWRARELRMIRLGVGCHGQCCLLH